MVAKFTLKEETAPEQPEEQSDETKLSPNNVTPLLSAA
jgi:hypothetical protein